jgi:hypothetical protein
MQDDLHLRADQEGAWMAYSDKVRALVGDIARQRARMPEKTPVLLELDRMIDSSRNRVAALEDVSASAKALFALLSPQQQAAADPRLATIVSALLQR